MVGLTSGAVFRVGISEREKFESTFESHSVICRIFRRLQHATLRKNMYVSVFFILFITNKWFLVMFQYLQINTYKRYALKIVQFTSRDRGLVM